MLCHFLQPTQRIRGSVDEPPAQERSNQPATPSWREFERPTERHSARVGNDARHANHFLVGHAKRQVNVHRTLFSRNDLADLKRHPDAMSEPRAKDKAIAFSQFAIRRFDQACVGPAREFAWRQNRAPHLLSRRSDELRWTNVDHQLSVLTCCGVATHPIQVSETACFAGAFGTF